MERLGPVPLNPGYMRPPDAAKFLGVSERTLAEWRRRRIIPYYKVRHKVCLFKKCDLDRAFKPFRMNAIGEESSNDM